MVWHIRQKNTGEEAYTIVEIGDGLEGHPALLYNHGYFEYVDEAIPETYQKLNFVAPAGE